jgi:alpha-amylase
MRRYPLALAAALLAACPAPARATGDAFPWWNDTVFYEVLVRSFADSDGDGVGDLPGLIERLDYLNDGDPATDTDLGVTGLWLMPITESPSYHGYDVTDYEHVDREYGTDDDFRTLMAEAHRRGIRVIVDLVLNHTSDRHPWFLASRSDARAEKRDWYVWRNDLPHWRGPWGEEVWHAYGNAYYYGVFSGGMPDLNYRNPFVTAAARDVERRWLTDFGADGFRLDAVKHWIEDDRNQENTPETHAWFREQQTWLKSVKPDALTVGEVWSGSSEVLPWIGTDVDLAFEFSCAGAMTQSARSESATAVRAALSNVARSFPPRQWATFLSNHDQDRVLSKVGGSVDHARTAASLLLTAPGVPFLYYGEEIGQSGTKPDENIRTPMQWSGDAHAGFTTGTPWRAPQNDFGDVNVAAERDDDGSLLSHYRKLIHLRNAHPALRTGAWIEVPCANRGVYACLRVDPEESLLVAINLTGESLEQVLLTVPWGPLPPGASSTRDLYVDLPAVAPVVNDAGGLDAAVSLPPYATRIIAFGPSPEETP